MRDISLVGTNKTLANCFIFGVIRKIDQIRNIAITGTVPLYVYLSVFSTVYYKRM